MKKNKNIILILAVIAALIALIYFVYLPQINKTLSLWNDITQKKEKVLTLEKKKDNLNNLRTQQKEIENSLKILTQILPTKKEAGGFLISFEFLAQKNGLNLDSIKFSEEQKPVASAPTAEDTGAKSTGAKTAPTTAAPAATASSASAIKYSAIVFDATIKGSYQNIISFLRELEKINRAISIEKADLSESQSVIEATLKGKIYYQND